MLASPESLAQDRVWDVVVVGSGPAGMTVAVALARLGREVLLLEGGAKDYSDESQAQYQGEVVGDPYFQLDACRMRMLGGTSVHWSGWCRPFEAEDFDRRDMDSMAVWPIGRADLDPYRATAARLLNARDDFWARDIGDGLKQFGFQVTPQPTRFGEAYWDELSRSRRLTLAMNSNLVGLETDSECITALTLADDRGLRRRVQARAFVMACGGIENSRLLLHFNAQTAGRLVKQPATLGRYWMEHPHFTIGTGIVPLYADINSFFHFQPAELRRRGLFNCGLRVHRTRPLRYRDRLASLACHVPALAEALSQRVQLDYACVAELRAAWEQAPRAANRIELDQGKRDAMGLPRVTLHWRRTADDHANMRELALAYGAHLVRQGTGRIRLAPWVLGAGEYPTDDEIAGYHHLGGTRMSDRPETGIVDRDLRVFGQQNLYMAGSSVFPTGGHVNPTLTIVQLSLRLADHLNRRALVA